MLDALERSPMGKTNRAFVWNCGNSFTKCSQTNRVQQRCRIPPDKFPNANTSLKMSNGRPRIGVLGAFAERGFPPSRTDYQECNGFTSHA